MKKKRKPTHRIPYETWINSQLSIARFYGGAIISGKQYVFDPEMMTPTEEGKYKPDLVTYQ